MFPFKWLIPNVLAGGCHPLLNGSFNLTTTPDYYTKQGVNLIISAFEVPISRDIRKTQTWDYYFAPTKDGQPSTDLYDICQKISTSGGTFCHCLHGLGRTSVLLASYLIFAGYAKTAKDAVLMLRKYYNEGAVHTPEQYLALLAFSGEHKNESDIEQLFNKKHNFYSGKETYKKLLDLGKRELSLLQEKFGEDSPEYKTSKRNHDRIQAILKILDWK